MIVIVLATIAIAVAVVIMVLPPSSSSEPACRQAAASQKAAAGPERMETDPLPPPGPGNTNGADPWGGHSQIDPPQAPATPKRPADPDDLRLADPDDFADPFAGMARNATGDFWFSALDHACQKLKTCPDANQTTIATVCDTLSLLPKSPTTCATGKRCLDAIDRLSCTQTGSLADPTSIVTMFQDCTTAATSC